MAGTANKVAFGLKNVHYALITEEVDGTFTYGTPIKYPGAVELSLDVKGEQSNFFADDVNYFTVSSNQGYEGTFTSAEAPESFRTDVLGEEKVNGVFVEKADAKIKPVALLFEFDGDTKATRHVLYNTNFNRPGLSGKTKEESVEVSTNELSFTAAPRPDGIVKTRTSSDTQDAVYNAWYTQVFDPVTVTPEV